MTDSAKDRGRCSDALCVVDHRPMWRDALRALLTEGPSQGTVIPAAAPEEVPGLLSIQPISVVLLEQGRVAGELVRHVTSWRTVRPRLRVMVIGATDQPGLVRAAERAGVNAYVSHEADAGDLRRALENVRADGTFFRVWRGARREADDDRRDDPLQRLSSREFDTLLLLCRGMRLKEIGSTLGVGTKTVHEYRRRMMAKLRAKNTVEMVRMAMASGVIPSSQSDVPCRVFPSEK